MQRELEPSEDLVELIARAIERTHWDDDQSFEEAWADADVVRHNRFIEARAVLASIAQQTGTPGARWRGNGEADPHGSRYDCERSALLLGHLTDDELANIAYVEPTAVNLAAMKDRIRWLSRQKERLERLEAALKPFAEISLNFRRDPDQTPVRVTVLNSDVYAARAALEGR